MAVFNSETKLWQTPLEQPMSDAEKSLGQLFLDEMSAYGSKLAQVYIYIQSGPNANNLFIKYIP